MDALRSKLLRPAPRLDGRRLRRGSLRRRCGRRAVGRRRNGGQCTGGVVDGRCGDDHVRQHHVLCGVVDHAAGLGPVLPAWIPGLTRDPFNRRVIAVVVGTFTYCLVVLQRVRGPLDSDGEAVIPNFALHSGSFWGSPPCLRWWRRSITQHSRWTSARSWPRSSPKPPAPRRRTRVSRHRPSRPTRRSALDLVRLTSHGWVRQLDLDALIRVAPPGGVVRVRDHRRAIHHPLDDPRHDLAPPSPPTTWKERRTASATP